MANAQTHRHTYTLTQSEGGEENIKYGVEEAVVEQRQITGEEVGDKRTEYGRLLFHGPGLLYI